MGRRLLRCAGALPPGLQGVWRHARRAGAAARQGSSMWGLPRAGAADMPGTGVMLGRTAAPESNLQARSAGLLLRFWLSLHPHCSQSAASCTTSCASVERSFGLMLFVAAVRYPNQAEYLHGHGRRSLSWPPMGPAMHHAELAHMWSVRDVLHVQVNPQAGPAWRQRAPHVHYYWAQRLLTRDAGERSKQAGLPPGPPQRGACPVLCMLWLPAQPQGAASACSCTAASPACSLVWAAPSSAHLDREAVSRLTPVPWPVPPHPGPRHYPSHVLRFADSRRMGQTVCG